MVNKAIRFAVNAHEGQCRKGTERPYILHPIEVASIVARMTDDQEVICAAVLHDTVEDCNNITPKLLREMFSPRVAELVAQESEDKSRTWMERKMNTVERLKAAPKEVQIIAMGDKLSNIRDIDRDYLEVGEELWKRFRMQDKNMIGWYYKSLRESLRESMQGTPAYEEYCRLVEKNFG